MIMVPINKKAKKKLDSFPPEQLDSIILMGCRHFEPVEIVKPLANISVPVADSDLQDKIAELSFRYSVRQSAVVGSILTTYCKKFTGTETLYQAQLHHKLGGEREVKTSVGFIDLLTDDVIVEVKEVKGWKGAIGQILCYNMYKYRKRKAIALYGRVTNKLKGEIEYCCSNMDIEVWWL